MQGADIRWQEAGADVAEKGNLMAQAEEGGNYKWQAKL